MFFIIFIVFFQICISFVVLSLVMIAHCSDLCGYDTYQDTVLAYSGQYAYVVCNVLIFVNNFGTCVMYLVIMADQIDQCKSYLYQHLIACSGITEHERSLDLFD